MYGGKWYIILKLLIFEIYFCSPLGQVWQCGVRSLHNSVPETAWQMRGMHSIKRWSLAPKFHFPELEPDKFLFSFHFHFWFDTNVVTCYNVDAMYYVKIMYTWFLFKKCVATREQKGSNQAHDVCGASCTWRWVRKVVKKKTSDAFGRSFECVPVCSQSFVVSVTGWRGYGAK